MPLSTKSWGSISESDYATAEEYCSACLIDMNESGQPKTKDKCKLPVKEPRSMGGNPNRNGMLAAQGALVGARGGVEAPAEEKKAAARKLARMMRGHGMEPADSMMGLM